MKLLILGLVPVVIFWFVEDKFGTFWGLIAAMVWAVGECVYEYVKSRRVEKLTLFSTGLVVLLGGLGAWLDKSVLFKFQPVIVELVFAGILVWGGRSRKGTDGVLRPGDPLLFQMAKKTRPETFANLSPAAIEFQKNFMGRMTRHLLIVLVIHSVSLAWLAVRGTTGQWAFWKGVGFNIFLLLWVGGEFAFLKFRRKAQL